jgi:hypothetical protein
MASTGQACAALMDILVDPAGGTSWSRLIDDLLVGGASSIVWNSTSPGLPLAYHFPLWIKAGSSIGARIRVQGTPTLSNTRVMAMAAGGNKNPASWWCWQKVESVATFDAANSLGQVVTPGASGSFGSWTNLGSATAARAGAAQWAVGTASGSTLAQGSWRWEFGAGGSAIGPCVYKGTTTTESTAQPIAMPIFCDIPAGAQLQVRGAYHTSLSSPSTDLDCAAYLVQ